MPVTNLPDLRIKSGEGDYSVRFFTSRAALVKELLTVPRDVVIVIDRQVHALHAGVLAPLLNGLPVLDVDPTEDWKTLDGVKTVGEWMQKQGASRRTTLVAIGGGIVQDVAGLTAHLYYRGINWRYVPTTLLSMSDSCIGAKVSVNLGAFKNQLGCFCRPAEVLVAVEFTETLSDHDLASGYGEILKLMVIGSEANLRSLERHVQDSGLRGPHLALLVRAALEVKRGYIESDEYEADQRRILNYGHTFGHALESLTAYSIPHGLAVAWGMDLVNWIALRRGTLSQADFDRVHGFVQARLPCRIPVRVAASALLQAARRDKKAAGDSVHLLLPTGVGDVRIVKTPIDAQLELDIASYLDGPNVYM